MRVPVQTKAFLLMADQLDLRIGGTRGLQTVLGAIVDQDLAINGKRCDNIRVLGLVACLVDLARVIDLLDNVELDDRRLAR